MKLKNIIEGEFQSSGPTTGYLGRSPAMASAYNYGYKGYYTGVDPNLAAVADEAIQNQLIDQAIDLMYSKYPDIVDDKKMKRHFLQMLVGKITQGDLRDRVDLDSFIKRLKKTRGVETI